jgi:hypothetical protein
MADNYARSISAQRFGEFWRSEITRCFRLKLKHELRARVREAFITYFITPIWAS